MVLKHLPAAVGAKINIVDVNPTLGLQNTKRLKNIVIAVPRFEMHEDYRAISNIYGRIRNVFHPRPEAIGTEA
jgi:hypothetical protein